MGNIPGIRKGCVAAFASPDRRPGPSGLSCWPRPTKRAPKRWPRSASGSTRSPSTCSAAPPDDIVLAVPRTVLKTSSGKIRRSASRTLYEQGAIGRRRWPGWLGTARLAWPAALPQFVRVRRAATAIAYNGCIWMLIGVAALPLLTLMLLLPYRSWRLAAGRTAIRLLFRLSGAPLVVDGDHHLEGLERFVIVANHPSFLDGFVLAAAVPASITFVAGEVFARQALSGFVLRRIGVAFVERTDRDKSIADTARLAGKARAGVNLVFFPEGGLSPVPGCGRSTSAPLPPLPPAVTPSCPSPSTEPARSSVPAAASSAAAPSTSRSASRSCPPARTSAQPSSSNTRPAT